MRLANLRHVDTPPLETVDSSLCKLEDVFGFFFLCRWQPALYLKQSAGVQVTQNGCKLHAIRLAEAVSVFEATSVCIMLFDSI